MQQTPLTQHNSTQCSMAVLTQRENLGWDTELSWASGKADHCQEMWKIIAFLSAPSRHGVGTIEKSLYLTFPTESWCSCFRLLTLPPNWDKETPLVPASELTYEPQESQSQDLWSSFTWSAATAALGFLITIRGTFWAFFCESFHCCNL